jgi:hypothetical protein
MPSQPKSSLLDVFLRTWYLGFTPFSGPVVHFQIFHRKFMEGQDPWLDEQTVRYLPFASSFSGFNDTPSQFQELFAICQALPGPASTKMGFCMACTRGGFLAAVMFFPDSEVNSISSRRSTYLWACHVLFAGIWYRMGHFALYISSWYWNILSQTVSVKSP